MARGRPALATVLMTTGIIALAVPGSSAFAGEFLILAGVFQRGWAWGVIGAGAIVLAAMYMLRLISAVLHRKRGGLVTDAALDLRPAELAVIVPLVACLLALSAWPAAVSGHSFARNPASDLAAQSSPRAYSVTQTELATGSGGITPLPRDCKPVLGSGIRMMTCTYQARPSP
jgi:NADH:ubiquinone oxidoreductase subunit 4 (subunit M)